MSAELEKLEQDVDASPFMEGSSLEGRVLLLTRAVIIVAGWLEEIGQQMLRR